MHRGIFIMTHLDRTLRSALAAWLALPVLAAIAFAGGSGGRAVMATDSMGPMEVPGINIKNFGVVNGHIYRGRQPKEDDYAALKALGITTVVDLRQDAEPYARQAAEAAGLKYVNIPMDDGDKPYDEQIATFLATVTDPANVKCYVHCAGGRHRTGATIAAYRMAKQGWSADAAYREMKAYDFYTRWGHGGYKTYVFDFYKRMQEDPSSVPAAYVARFGITP
jgi:protein tyrosine/serine phosphatase